MLLNWNFRRERGKKKVKPYRRCTLSNKKNEMTKILKETCKYKKSFFPTYQEAVNNLRKVCTSGI